MTRSYIGVVKAKPGCYLLGGGREHRSSRFTTRENAGQWVAVVQHVNGENVEEAHIEGSDLWPELPELPEGK